LFLFPGVLKAENAEAESLKKPCNHRVNHKITEEILIKAENAEPESLKLQGLYKATYLAVMLAWLSKIHANIMQYEVDKHWSFQR
jgi:hypothetical protein